MKIVRGALFAALIAALTIGNSVRAESRKLNVVATITIIQDIAQNVAGDKADVTSLIPANGDAHEYDPKPQDVRKMSDADLILENGLLLEGFLDKLITESGTKAKVVIVSKGLPVHLFGAADTILSGAATPSIAGISGEIDCAALTVGAKSDSESGCDPHMWQDVKNTIGYANNIRDAFIEADPANADAYKANAAAYIAKLEKLDADIVDSVATVPAENRQLVTNHDAIGYFAARYGFTIVGVVLPGGGTGKEPSPQEIAKLIDSIRATKIKAVFLENVSNDQFAQQIAKEAGVLVVQGLYTDALGDAGSSGATYIDMMTSNAKLVVDALK